MFKPLLTIGKHYEAVVAEYLVRRGYEVEFVGDAEEYQRRDIDLKARMKGSRELEIEVKADHRIKDTGNIFVEESMDRYSGNRDGWYHYCEADILCYHDVYGKKGYFIDWKKMKRELEGEGYKRREFNNISDNCVGYMYLVTIDEANENGWLIEEYSLGEGQEVA